tara:strand:- start:8028 stop:8933 length:906 start_codon:yes stop_codon:yes gene_type:complete
MKIAIVGGSGFIGRHTAQELREHGHDVTIFDKVEGVDALDMDKLYYAFKRSLPFDAVYMFAAISDSKENLTDIQYAVHTNIMCLTNTLKVCECFNIPRIIFSSTVWVYSVSQSEYNTEENMLPITESDHIYTTCKLACESIVKNYCAVRDIDYTILRYGIAYGPDCHPDMILSKFITNALNGKKLIITGNGDTFRNFLYVTDHARGNRLALDDAARNQIINLEGPEKVTLKEVAARVKELHSKDTTIIFTSERHGDYKGKHVSNSKAKSLLDWEPKVSFKEGSKQLYEYIKKNINSSAACR